MKKATKGTSFGSVKERERMEEMLFFFHKYIKVKSVFTI